MTLKELMSRSPLTVPTMAMAMGCSASHIELPTGLLAVVLSLAVVVTGTVLRMRRVRHYACWPVMLLTLGAFASLGHYNAQWHTVEFLEGQTECRAWGRVTSKVSQRGAKCRVVLEADSVKVGDVMHYGRKGMLTLDVGEGGLQLGEQICAKGQTTWPSRGTLTGFDYQAYLENEGISFSLAAQEWQAEGERRLSLATLSGMCQEAFSGVLSANGVSDRNIGFLRALVLGDKSLLDPEIRSDFSTCGTSHVLAVSGLHVGIICAILNFLLGEGLKMSKRPKVVASTIALWAYAFVVGMPTSVTRASIMFSFMTLSTLVGHKISRLHTLSASMFVILLTDPLAINSVGFWLSYAAVGGILACGRNIHRLTEYMPLWVGKLVESLGASIVAQTATAPIIIYSFHSFPTYFWLNNLVIIFIIEYMVYGALLCAALGWVPWLGTAIGWATDKMMNMMMGYAHWASGLPGASIDHIGMDRVEIMALGIVVVMVLTLMAAPSAKMVKLSAMALCAYAMVTLTDSLMRQNNHQLWLTSCRGNVALTLVNGPEAKHVLRQEMDNGLDDALKYAEQELHIGQSTTQTMAADSVIVMVGQHKVALYSAARGGETYTDADIVIIDGDLLPQDFAANGAKYLITTNCHFADVWQKQRAAQTQMVEHNSRLMIMDTKEESGKRQEGED